MSEEKPKWLVTLITEHLKFVAAASVSISLLMTGIWWAFGPRIEESARELVGTAEIRDIVVEQGVRIERATEAIDGLSGRITAIEPSPSVAEFDILRSAIDPVCAPSGVCEFTFRVRRTSDGISCGPPSSQHVLIDNSGTTFFPRPARPEQRNPQRLSEDWSVVTSAFIVPRNVSEGVAEFSLQLTYPDCDRDALGRVVVVEETPHLIFEIARPDDQSRPSD